MLKIIMFFVSISLFWSRDLTLNAEWISQEQTRPLMLARPESGYSPQEFLASLKSQDGLELVTTYVNGVMLIACRPVSLAQGCTVKIGDMTLNSLRPAQELKSSPEMRAMTFPDPAEFIRHPDGRLSLRVYFPQRSELTDKHIRLEPSQSFTVGDVEYNYWYWDRKMSSRFMVDIFSDFKPQSEVKLTLLAGLKNEEEFLASDYETRVLVPDFHPVIRFASHRPYISSVFSEVSLEVMNLKRVRIKVFRLLDQNQRYFTNFMQGDSDEFERFSEPMADKIFDTKNQLNQWSVLRVQLAELLTVKKAGVFQLQAEAIAEDVDKSELERRYSWSEPELPQDRRMAFLSDLGILARRLNNELLIHTYSLSTAISLPDVGISLFNHRNVIVAQGKTDSQGTMMVPVLPGVDLASIHAEGLQDSNVLLLNEALDVRPGQSSRLKPASASLKAVILQERDIYRSRDHYTAQILVKDGNLKSTSLTLQYSITGPSNQRVAHGTVTTSSNGLAQIELPILATMALGEYRTEVKLGSKILGNRSFTISDFTPPRLRLQVHHCPEKIMHGDSLKARMQANWTMGMAAQKQRGELRLRATAATLQLKRQPGFHFGPYTEENSKDRDLLNLTESAVTDKDGEVKFAIDLPLQSDPGAGVYQGQALFTVFDEGREVSQLKTFEFYTAPVLSGVKLSKSIPASLPATLEANIIRYDPMTDSVLGGLAIARIYRLTWHMTTQGGSRRFRRERSLVHEEVLDTTRNLKWSALQSGSYLIEAQDPQHLHTAALEVYVGGYDDPSMDPRTEGEKLILASSQNTAGSVAIDVRSPFAGNLLLTLETDRFLDTKRFTMPARSALLSLKLPENLDSAPRVYANVIRPVTSQEQWQPLRAQAEMDLDRPQNGMPPLHLEIVCPAKAAASAAMLPIQITGDFTAGSEIVIHGVDRAVLELTNSTSTDLLKTYRNVRHPNGLSYDFMDQIDTIRKQGEKVLFSGGGASEDALKRFLPPEALSRQIKPFAFSHVQTVTSSGRASFDLPLSAYSGFEGEVLLSAYVASATNIGQSSASVILRDDVSIRPLWPKLLRSQDLITSSLTLLNHTTVVQTLDLVAVSEPGLNISLDCQNDTTSCRVDVQPQSSLVLPMILHAHKAGAFPVKIMSTREPAVSRATVLTVLPVSPPRRVRQILSAVNPTLMATPAELSHASLIQLELLSSLEQELGSHGKSLAYHASNNSLSEWAASLIAQILFLRPPHMDGHARSSVAKILSLQRMDGSFRQWKEDSEPDRAAGILALDALIEAKERGYLPDSRPIRLASAELNRYLQSQNLQSYLENPALYGYAAWVLSRIQELGVHRVNWMHSHSKNLPSQLPASLHLAILKQHGYLQEAQQFKPVIAPRVWFSPVQDLAMTVFFLKQYQHSSDSELNLLSEKLANLTRNSPWLGNLDKLWLARAYQGSQGSPSRASFSLGSGAELILTSSVLEFPAQFPVVFSDLGAETRILATLEGPAANRRMTNQSTGLSLKTQWLSENDLPLREKSSLNPGDRVKVKLELHSQVENEALLLFLPAPSCMEFPPLSLLANGMARHQEFRDEGYFATFISGSIPKSLEIPLTVISKGICQIPGALLQSLKRGEEAYDRPLLKLINP